MMLRHNLYRVCVACCGLSCLDGEPAFAQEQRVEPDQEKQITVKAKAQDIEPILTLDEQAITKTGAQNLADLLRMLGPLTQSASGQEPILALDGRKPVDDQEIFSLPMEAFASIEILPESAALAFGFPSTRKVLNFITKKRFAALEMQGGAETATQGGQSSATALASYTKIRNQKRLTIKGEHKTQDQLLQSDRDIAIEPGNFDNFSAQTRSLLPANDVWKWSATLGLPVGESLAASLNGTVNHTDSRSLNGESRALSRPLTSRSQQEEQALSGGLKGWLGGWSWTLQSKWGRNENKSRYELDAMNAGGGQTQRFYNSQSINSTQSIDALFHGDAMTLPAGNLALSPKLSVQRDKTQIVNTSPDGTHSSVNKGRDQARASLSASIPIWAKQSDGGPIWPGVLTADMYLALSATGSYGALVDYTAGLNWQTSNNVHFAFSQTHTETMPELAFIAQPETRMPNTPYFDFATGQNALVTLRNAGNPNLPVRRDNHIETSVNYTLSRQPDLGIRLSYSTQNIHNQAGLVSASSAKLQAAFPEIFTRNAEGALIAINAIPVALAREKKRQLSFMVYFQGLLGELPEGEGAFMSSDLPQVYLSLNPTYQLRDTLLLREGVPVLDLLNGDTRENGGGQAHFAMEEYLRLNYKGVTLTQSLHWQGATRVKSDIAASDLHFANLATIDMSVSAMLDQIFRQAKWAKSASVTLDVTNLTGARRRVTDRNGDTPYSYQPAFLDPAGRTVRINLRKLF